MSDILIIKCLRYFVVYEKYINNIIIIIYELKSLISFDTNINNYSM